MTTMELVRVAASALERALMVIVRKELPMMKLILYDFMSVFSIVIWWSDRPDHGSIKPQPEPLHKYILYFFRYPAE